MSKVYYCGFSASKSKRRLVRYSVFLDHTVFSLHILDKPFHGNGKEEVVTLVVQMGGVFGSLEILLAEAFVAHLDDGAFGIVVKHGDVVFVTSILPFVSVCSCFSLFMFQSVDDSGC